MSQRYTAPDEPRREPILSLAAIIAAGLASATAAIIRPFFNFGESNTILGAAFTAIVITTSSAIYKAYLENAESNIRSLTSSVRPSRRRRSVLFMGILAGIAACIIGIVGISSFEKLVLHKTPSIMNDSQPIIPPPNYNNISSPPSLLPPSPPPSPPPPDKIPPTIIINTPGNGASYKLNMLVKADYNCADTGGSGVKSCIGNVANGSPIDTNSLGPKSFTVTAEDYAGNKATPKAVNYNVIP